MNNNVDAQPQVGSFISPLIISGAGIVCSCLALATYHFILFRFCVHSHQELEEITFASARSSPQHVPSGVDPEILHQIPILPYSPNKGHPFRLDQNECVICLGELEHGEKLRLLPSCKHAFHIPCIDLWFSQHTNCPICRSPILINVTTSSTLSLPLPSHQNDAQQSPSLDHRHHHHDHHAPSGSQSQASPPPPPPPPPPVLLQHSLSCHTQQKTKHVLMGLKRSLSMDQSSYISIIIHTDQEKAASSTSSSPSPSSSSSSVTTGISQPKPISLTQNIDQVSSILMTSLSQFRNSRIQTSRAILPN